MDRKGGDTVGLLMRIDCICCVLREKRGRLVLCECDTDITKSFKDVTRDSGMFLVVFWDLCRSLKLQGQTMKREMKNQQPP